MTTEAPKVEKIHLPLPLQPNLRIIPNWRARIYSFLSLQIWGMLPAEMQRGISRIYTKIYNTHWSKYQIKPYVNFHYGKESNYLKHFKPPYGQKEYTSFQDFFIRQFKIPPQSADDSAWPCEGVICHAGHISSIPYSTVKGQVRPPHTIFGLENEEELKGYFFSNVFLHNNNYHRIHSPIDGVIRRIQTIKGELVVLRPWIYLGNPSIPAFQNERVNLDIEDKYGRLWYLSIVGGPAVGSIELLNDMKVGDSVKCLDEIALFYLGSTLCIAAPQPPMNRHENDLVWVGDTYEMQLQ